MRINTDTTVRNKIILISILAMLVSLLVSRAALSASMMIFLALTLFHKNIVNQIKTFLSSRFLAGMAALFLIPLVSGLWSHDIESWANITRIKLPLLVLPLAFAGTWHFPPTYWKALSFLFNIIILIGIILSLTDYFRFMDFFQQAYLKAKLMNTPLGNDHVRFSWLVAVSVINCFLLLDLVKKKVIKTLLIILIFLFIAYLFMLSARTGIFCLFIFLIFHFIRQLWIKKNIIYSIFIIFSVFIIPIVAWFSLSTFRNRIRYNKYDISFVLQNKYLPGSNDGARFLSIEAGCDVLYRHPWGTGAGDIMNETDKWYRQHVPGIISTDKFYPSNEWLMYGAFAGWPGVMAFTAIIILFFLIKTRYHRFFWTVLNAIGAFSFIFDMPLEVQFGVFIFCFILLWWHKWFNQTSEQIHG